MVPDLRPSGYETCSFSPAGSGSEQNFPHRGEKRVGQGDFRLTEGAYGRDAALKTAAFCGPWGRRTENSRSCRNLSHVLCHEVSARNWGFSCVCEKDSENPTSGNCTREETVKGDAR